MSEEEDNTKEEELQMIAGLTVKMAELMLRIVEAINAAVEAENQCAADLIDKSAD